MATANVTSERESRFSSNWVTHTSIFPWAHQVTTAALFYLEIQAFRTYKDGLEVKKLDVKSMDEWYADIETYHPQFLDWSKILKLEIFFHQFM